MTSGRQIMSLTMSTTMSINKSNYYEQAPKFQKPWIQEDRVLGQAV